jgi:hypothetical protein
MPTVNVPAPPPLSDVQLAAGQTQGWVRYQADNTAIEWIGDWQVFGTGNATRVPGGSGTTFRSAGGLYKYSKAADAAMRLAFHGAGVRVRYAGCAACGVFEVRVDGRVMREVNSYYSKQADSQGYFGTTEYWSLSNGDHEIEVVSMNRKDPQSSDVIIAIDAIEVYRTDVGVTVMPSATAPPPTATFTATFTASPMPVGGVEIVKGPPEVPPTAALDVPVNVLVSLLVAYNQSGNGVAEPGEGVPGISVRLVDVRTNEVVASGMTDSRGQVTLSATTIDDLRLVIPYWQKVFEVGRESQNLTLVLPPGNIPGLIP